MRHPIAGRLGLESRYTATHGVQDGYHIDDGRPCLWRGCRVHLLRAAAARHQAPEKVGQDSQGRIRERIAPLRFQGFLGEILIVMSA